MNNVFKSYYYQTHYKNDSDKRYIEDGIKKVLTNVDIFDSARLDTKYLFDQIEEIKNVYNPDNYKFQPIILEFLSNRVINVFDPINPENTLFDKKFTLPSMIPFFSLKTNKSLVSFMSFYFFKRGFTKSKKFDRTIPNYSIDTNIFYIYSETLTIISLLKNEKNYKKFLNSISLLSELCAIYVFIWKESLIRKIGLVPDQFQTFLYITAKYFISNHLQIKDKEKVEIIAKDTLDILGYKDSYSIKRLNESIKNISVILPVDKKEISMFKRNEEVNTILGDLDIENYKIYAETLKYVFPKIGKSVNNIMTLPSFINDRFGPYSYLSFDLFNNFLLFVIGCLRKNTLFKGDVFNKTILNDTNAKRAMKGLDEKLFKLLI